MKSLPGASAEGRKCESLGIIIPYHPKYAEFNEIHHYIMWGYVCIYIWIIMIIYATVIWGYKLGWGGINMFKQNKHV